MRFGIIAALVAALACCGPKAASPVEPPLYLCEIGPGVWRSAQPDGPSEWSFVSALKITRVIKLNYDFEGSDAEAIEHHIAVTETPLAVGDTTPSDWRVYDALQAIEAATAKGDRVLVHDTDGLSRVAIIAAAYRLRVLHRPKPEAALEILRFGAVPLDHHFLWWLTQ